MLQLIQKAFEHPEHPIPEEDDLQKTASRYECSVNTLHQIDLILRKCVAEYMKKCNCQISRSILLKNIHVICKEKVK